MSVLSAIRKLRGLFPVTRPELEVGKVSVLAMYAFSEVERGRQP